MEILVDREVGKDTSSLRYVGDALACAPIRWAPGDVFTEKGDGAAGDGMVSNDSSK